MQLMLCSHPPKLDSTPHNTVLNPAMPTFYSQANSVHAYILLTAKCCQALVLYTCCMHIKYASCDQWHCWPPDHMRICRCTHAPAKPDTITAHRSSPHSASTGDPCTHAPANPASLAARTKVPLQRDCCL